MNSISVKTRKKSLLAIESPYQDDFNRFINNLHSISKLSKAPNQKKVNNKITYNNTFIVEYAENMNPNLDYTYLIKLLKEYGLQQSKKPLENHLFGIISPAFYNTKFYLLNNFQFVKSISDKYNLYFYLKLLFPEHYNSCYPNSFLLTLNTTYNDLKNIIYIARPISSWSGKDIIVIDSNKNLENTKQLLNLSQYTSGISLTEYVSNLVRYNGRKMHLRAYFCITLLNNIFNTYLLDTGGIYIAKEKYQNADWNNKDFHDTHFGNTGLYLFFPNDLFKENATNPKITKKEWDIIYDNMRTNLKYISKIAVNNIFKYTNCENAFEVFGCDFFIRDDLSTFLIEINSKNVGYKGFASINTKYFDWLNDIVLKPLFRPLLKIDTTLATTPIYTQMILDY